MKASELIRQIVEMAEEKFGVDTDTFRDTISVGLYPADAERWQAWLLRPTYLQLQTDTRNNVNIDTDLAKPTTMKWECETHFYVEGSSMMDALHQLHDQLTHAEFKCNHVELAVVERFVPNYNNVDLLIDDDDWDDEDD